MTVGARAAMVAALAAGAGLASGCVQVFGLDELAEDQHTATFSTLRLTMAAATPEPRPPRAARYWYLDDLQPAGLAAIDAGLDGATARATIPDGPYLLEVEHDDAPRLLLASDARALTHAEVVHGRADLALPNNEVTVGLSLTLAAPLGIAPELDLDTVGVWTHTTIKSLVGQGSSSDPVIAGAAWLPARASPPGSPFGLWSPADLILIGHRTPTTYGSRLVQSAALTGLDQSTTSTLSTRLEAVAVQTVATESIDPSPAERAAATPLRPTTCSEQVAAHLVRWPEVGSVSGPLLGAIGPAPDGTLEMLTYGLPSGLAAFSLRTIASAGCNVLLEGTELGVTGVQARPLGSVATLTVELPFVTEVTVDGAVLRAGVPTTIAAGTGPLRFAWSIEAGRAVPAAYRVALIELGALEPVTIWQALTVRPPLTVPRALVPAGPTYALVISAVSNLPGYGAGDATPVGELTATTTPSPAFTVAP